MLLIILAVGLNPKGFHFSNNVAWITERPGIRFSRYGIAYTQPLTNLIQENGSGPDGFSLEIALKPANERRRGFKFILAFHNGDDGTQFLLGQWRSTIIVMNANDYAYRRKTKRISAVPPQCLPELSYAGSGVEYIWRIDRCFDI